MKLIDTTGLECRVNRLVGAQVGTVPLAVFYIDLSRIQLIDNDYSYALGNQVLQEVECRLEEWLDGRAGFVMPIDADHFLVAIAGRHCAARAEEEAGAIRRRLRSPMALNEAELCIDARVSVLTIDTINERHGSFRVRNANIAAAQAKRAVVRGIARFRQS